MRGKRPQFMLYFKHYIRGMRRLRTRMACSPRPRMLTRSVSKVCPLRSEPQNSWAYIDDMWIAIAKFLDAKSLISLALTNRDFYRLLMGDMSIWKLICLRDLEVPQPQTPVLYSWKDLYIAAFDGSHSYSYRQAEKHIDWMRIGAFIFDSSEAFVTENLLEIKSASFEVLSDSSFILSNISTGIWIADLQLVRCPVCNLKTCEGTMQTLDIRHFELFLCKEYKDDVWDYEEAGSRTLHGNCFAATAGIFDVRHVKSESTLELVNTKSWVGKPADWEPKVKVSPHAVAVSTNLQDNEGLYMRCNVLKAGENGPILAIRVSQQLI